MNTDEATVRTRSGEDGGYHTDFGRDGRGIGAFVVSKNMPMKSKTPKIPHSLNSNV